MADILAGKELPVPDVVSLGDEYFAFTELTTIAAAAELGLRVIFLARPVMPDADRVATTEDVLAWVARYADH